MSPAPAWVIITACVSVQIGFAGGAVLIKKYAQEEKTDPLVFSTLRDVFAFPVLLGAALFFEGWHPPRGIREEPANVAGAAIVLFGLLGFFGMLCNQLFFVLGMYMTSPGIAAIMQPTIPILTSIFAIALGLEPAPDVSSYIGFLKVAGIACSVSGAVVMVASKSPTTANKDSVAGMIFLGVNVTSMAIYIVAQKLLLFSGPTVDGGKSPRLFNVRLTGVRGRLDWIRRDCRHYASLPVNVTAWAYLFGAGYMTACCSYYAYIGEWERFRVPRASYIPLTYAALVSSAMCYGILSWANKHMHASIVTALWPLQVPTVAVLSYIIFGDTLTIAQVVGGCLIAGGLVGVAWSEYRKSKLTTSPPLFSAATTVNASPYTPLSYELFLKGFAPSCLMTHRPVLSHGIDLGH